MAAATAGLSVGTRCFIPDATHVWLPVSVEQVDERARTAVVKPQPLPGANAGADESLRDVKLGEKDGGGAEFPLQNLAVAALAAGVDNMISLDHLHEAAILQNLRKRFAAGLPYTYTGDICVAVNPYRWLDALYAHELHAQYLRAKTTSALPPHVYAVAVAAYRHLRDDAQNQSILVSGESGAGKTETTKIVMDNLATIAAGPSSGSGQQQLDPDQRQATISRIVEVNPLLESFGNATTKRNDNSSRFGKFTQLQFDGANVLCGAQCETYLLEKTRVVTQDPGERNYHIFYQLVHGATSEEKQAFGLDQAFRYLRRDDAVHTEKVVSRDVRNYGRTKQALGLLGFDSQQQEALFQVIAGILHLGEASFVPLAGNEDASSLNAASVALSSVLLGLDATSMEKGLCNRTMRVGGGEVYAVPLTPAQATTGRDALAKAIYARLFDFMVERINASLSADEASLRSGSGAIGVLDIFGFESFTHNSFEQLCINYANEKLQQKFTMDVFRTVQDEYASEGITWDHISYPDNSAVLALIEGKLGIIALLNEETVRPKGNAEGFVSKLATAYRKDKHLIEFPRLSRTQFAIHHYAEKVTYEANGFLEKHKDSLLSDLSDLMLASREPFVQKLFIEKAAPTPPAATKGRPASKKFGGGAGGNDSSKTVGSQFKVSLSKLMETITTTNVHYIRCIKPNSIKSPEAFDSPMVVNQLRCAGVIEAVTIARAGYPNRMAHDAFAEQFDIFLTEAQQTSGDHVRNCQVLASHFKLVSPDEFQMGKTKIYLQKGIFERLERARAERLFAYAASIQSRWRGVLARQYYALLRAALVVIQRRAKVFVAQCRFQKQQLGVRTIQRVYRGHQGRQIYHALRRERAAMRIQSAYRGLKGRQIFFAVLCQSKAVRIQCAVRQRFARKALAARRVEYEAEQAKLAAEERERQRIVREEQLRREEEERQRQRAEREERLRREEEERQEKLRLEEEERQEKLRREEEERQEKLRREEEERQEKLRREEEENQRLALLETSAVQIQKCVRGFSGRRLFRELVLEKEQEEARRAEEEERERQRLLREQQELEAARRAAEEAERERMRQAEERKRVALQRRQQREQAAVTVQRHVRGRLQRQKFAELKVESAQAGERRDEELERVRAENESLKQQLDQLVETNHELESLVAEWKCERDVLLASNNLREVELAQQLSAQKKELDAVRREYSTLCDYMEKNSAGSTEPDELHSGASEHEDVEQWDDDSSSDSSVSGSPRSSFERGSSGPTASSSSSFFEDDRPSADVSKLMRPSRPTNIAARTSRLGASLAQRRQAASRSYQRGKEEASKKLSASASAVTRAKKWVNTSRKTNNNNSGGSNERASSKHHYEPRSMEF